MPRILVSLLLAATAIAAAAQGKSKDPKPDLALIFKDAQYVHVEAFNGDRDSQDLFSGDREAIYNVEKQLHDWDRYRTTMSRDEAELVLVVHRARPADSTVPVVIGGGQRPGSKSPFPRDPTDDGGGRGTGVDEQVGSPDDQLSVYIVNGLGALTGPIWTRTAKNGLKTPQLSLFKQLKHDVEEAYPR